MPTVAWNRAARPDQINALLRLHRLYFNLLQRPPYLARRQGSALVLQVLETLRQAAEGTSAPLRPVPHDARLVIYVGHDTNLANIGGMLGVDWTFASGLEDRTPPAGAMAFELLREAATGHRFVRMTYHNQTLEQMRHATPLSPPAPQDAAGVNRPDVATIQPGCANIRDGMCPWSDFVGWMRGALDPQCASLHRQP
jgi:4-phytase/acid phosphatase